MHAARSHAEINRCTRFQHHGFKCATVQQGSKWPIEKITTHLSIQRLARWQDHSKLLQRKCHRTLTFVVAIGKLAALHVELHVKAFHQFITAITSGGNSQIETPHFSFDALYAHQ